MKFTATLREVDGKLVADIPENVARECGLREGLAFHADMVEGTLVLTPRRSKYTVQELLDQCDFSAPMDKEERDWLDAPRVGRELI